MLKKSGSRSSIMLMVFPKNSLNLILGKSDSAIDFDTVDFSLVPPTLKSLGAYAKELSRLGRREELPLEIHWSPMNFLILYRVLGCGLEVLPLRIPATAEWDILRNIAT